MSEQARTPPAFSPGIREEERAALALMRVPGVGADMFRRLMKAFGTPFSALRAVQDGRARDAGFDVPRPTKKRPVEGLVERAFGAMERFSSLQGLVWYGNERYPERLLNVPEPPPILFWQGIYAQGRFFRAPTLGIVGARKATPRGKEIAAALSRFCVGKGVTIVSGGALGIDAEAHRGALDAGGITAAVIATGIDVWYPEENRSLFERIVDHGVVVTEFFPGTPPVRSHFPTRNRIIAGLSDALVFIEGSAKSGALITVRRALDAGRPVFFWSDKGLNEGGIEAVLHARLPVSIVKSPEEVWERLPGLMK
ncbi:MAG: DNA-processing protein DprA [Candidatus Ozemobacteraceae bacterium]